MASMIVTMINIKKLIQSGRIWPVMIVTGLAVFVAVNVAFMTVAFKHKPQLVSEQYYAEGFNLKQIAANKASGDATGWQVLAQTLPRDQSERPLVQLTVSGPGADSLSGSAAFYRASDQTMDVPAQALRSIGGGKYLVVLPRPLEYGSWQAVVHLERGKQQLDTRVRLYVEK
jgi:nitrogen fixation protein FixH